MTKMVQLSDAAYARLKGLKRTGESFSDVVIRLTGRGDLRDLAKNRRSEKELREHIEWIRRVDDLDRPR